MGTAGTASAAAPGATAPEVLTWDREVVLSGESRPPVDGERGFVLRLHADPGCPERLAPQTRLVARGYEQVRAEALCPRCTADVVAVSASSVLRRLRDADRTLRRLLATAREAPVPREIVHCRALRYEAEQAVSVHPQVRAAAADVAELAGEVAEALREGLREGLRTSLRPR